MLFYTFYVDNNQISQQVTISLFADVLFLCCLLTRLEREGKMDFESLHRNIFPGRLHTLHLCSSDIDLEYVACIYIDLSSAYFLCLSIHRNFQHRNFTICQCRGISESKKIISMVDRDTVERQKKAFLKTLHRNFENLPCNLTKFGPNLTKICKKWPKFD